MPSPDAYGVFQEHQADRAALPRVATGVHGHGGKGDGLCAALRLFEGDGHQVAHRCRSRGLADFRWRNAQGNHEPRPEFTYRRLLDAADGSGWARRSWGSAHSPRWSAMPASPSPSARRCRSPRATATAHRVRFGPRMTRCCACGLVPTPKRGQKVQFKAMVVGATGAIGSVCARMMATVAEEVYMVSPGDRQAALAQGVDPEGDAGCEAVPVSRADKDIAAWT